MYMGEGGSGWFRMSMWRGNDGAQWTQVSSHVTMLTDEWGGRKGAVPACYEIGR
jgi:hypothetical protein